MSVKAITITYEVEDGYAGGSRPHSVRLDLNDFGDCETPEDIERRIDECVSDHFRENIGPYWKRDQIEEVFDLVMAEREAEDAAS